VLPPPLCAASTTLCCLHHFVLPPPLSCGPEHQHDLSMTSVSFALKGGLNMHEISDGISNLIKTDGPSLVFRYRGILDIMESSKRFVFQGVHMLFCALDEP
jgi:G3E family GTPase